MTPEPESSDEAEYVGGGGFTVDRRRAVRKLASFQLPKTFGASLLLIRAAVAAKANHIRIQQQDFWTEIRFEGEPFSYSLLQDPYAPILGDREADAKERFLAYGLIHSFSYGPGTVTLRTGVEPNRYRLVLTPNEDGGVAEDLQRVEGSGETENSVQLEWPPSARRGARQSHLTRSSLQFNCAMCPCTIALGDTLLHDPLEDFPSGEMFEWRGAKIIVDEPPAGSTGYLELFHYGVLVRRISFEGEAKGFRVWVDDPGLSLTASLDGVAQNQRFKSLLREIRSL